MKHPTSFFIDKQNYDKCVELVELDEFGTVSEVIVYAMRFFSENLRLGTLVVVPKARGELVKVSLRVDVFVLEKIMSTKFLERSVVPDQSLVFYFKWRERFKD